MAQISADEWQRIKPLWPEVKRRFESDQWFRDNVWPEMESAIDEGRLRYRDVQRYLAMKPKAAPDPQLQFDEPPPPPPAVGTLSPGSADRDCVNWTIDVAAFPTDPKGIYLRLAQLAFGGDLPDAIVEWGTTAGAAVAITTTEYNDSDPYHPYIVPNGIRIVVSDSRRGDMDAGGNRTMTAKCKVINNLLHEACHVWFNYKGMFKEGHGPKFRSLLLSKAKKFNMNYDNLLGDWQEDMKETRTLRSYIDMVVQLSEANAMKVDDTVQGSKDRTSTSRPYEPGSSDDPFADWRNEAGNVVLYSHGGPTMDDYLKRLDSWSRKQNVS